MRKAKRTLCVLLVILMFTAMGTAMPVKAAGRAGFMPVPTGDFTDDGAVTREDVIELLLHVSMPDVFPLRYCADFTDDQAVTREDVVELLLHVSMPGTFPVSTGAFMAGFGMEDISPTASVPLDSYGDARNRMSTGSYTKLEARCVAVKDGDGQLMLFLTGDVSWAPNALGKAVRTQLSQELGISQEHIIVSGTHTHASVATSLTDIPSVVSFNEGYIAGMKVAAREAIADLKPAEIYIGSVQTSGMNHVRRYIMDDGSLVGDNAYGTGSYIVRHETDADPELQLMKFVREGGKDILISQFQGHPHLEGKTKNYSSQTVGAIRDAVEKELGVHSLHWQGASGNLNTHSRISSENKYAQSNAGRIKYGQDMCNYIEKVYDSMTQVNAGKVQVRKVTYTANVNHMYDHMIADAQKVVNYFNSGHTAGETATYAHQFKDGNGLRINSYYHANRILANAKLGATRDMDLAAWSIGEVGGVVLPYEMFDTSGMQMKTESPFEKTFIVGYAYPSYGGYIPTREGYANGGYESDNSTFAPGTAEGMVENYLNMLENMYG